MAAGRVLAGRYRLDRQLGAGGMGSVWRAEHLALRSAVAVKLIAPELVAYPAALARFLREAQATAALRSAHIVQILDYGVDDGTPFIVMELLEGESLESRLERGCLTPGQTAHVVTHVARAAGRAHQAGLVHRDLKPANVFIVASEDDEEQVKVLDFGVAKVVDQSNPEASTQTGALLGTPFYMSPEQASGRKEVDGRTDVWALGCIAFECLLGQRAFEAATLGSVVLKICSDAPPTPSLVGVVPAGFDEWFARATHRDPAQRFQTMKDAAVALGSVCGAEVPVAQRLSDRAGSPLAFAATQSERDFLTTVETPPSALVSLDVPAPASTPPQLRAARSTLGELGPTSRPTGQLIAPRMTPGWVTIVAAVAVTAIATTVVLRRPWEPAPSAPTADSARQSESASSQLIDLDSEPSLAPSNSATAVPTASAEDSVVRPQRPAPESSAAAKAMLSAAPSTAAPSAPPPPAAGQAAGAARGNGAASPSGSRLDKDLGI